MNSILFKRLLGWCRTMSERSSQSIMTSDHRGFSDETSGRGVSVDDVWQGRSPAEHPPSLRTTLLPITIDVSRGVLQGSDSSVSRASRELQLQLLCLHIMRAARAEQLKPWRGACGLQESSA